ncbi:(2Fe-2S)-binding protein [Polaromonas jejuensis]|uniref:(2Fe-2S)-binding protein n=1 Tax=Polaromonas jejuensis TaxID=457502 RepID=A0ABW0QC39_9BURK|nr:(2Fe-2S)-binding protein [Polaromonas jejuensis]
MISLRVNGRTVQVDAEPDTPLLWVIRENLKLTGTKYGCGVAACGACTVHVGGNAVRSCSLPLSAVGNQPVTTIEAIGADRVGKAVQVAWIKHDVPQCGYCQSGQVMTAVDFLKKKKHPTEAEVIESMGGNLCRCGTYERIKAAVLDASRSLA